MPLNGRIGNVEWKHVLDQPVGRQSLPGSLGWFGWRRGFFAWLSLAFWSIVRAALGLLLGSFAVGTSLGRHGG